MKRQIKH